MLGLEALHLAAVGVGWPQGQQPLARNPAEPFILDLLNPFKQSNKTASKPLNFSR